MSWPKRIILVRHGESEGNIKSPDDMSFDLKANHSFTLTTKGREQAQRTGEYLHQKYGEFDSYFCSTFIRTQETLRIMYPEILPRIDSRLNELWRGVWHTMSKEKICIQYPDELMIRKREGEYHYRPPGGQNGQDVETMIHSFIQQLRFDHVNESILISSHGNWMLLFWRIMLNLKPEEFELRYNNDKYKNSAIAAYERYQGKLYLTSDNFVP